MHPQLDDDAMGEYINKLNYLDSKPFQSKDKIMFRQIARLFAKE